MKLFSVLLLLSGVTLARASEVRISYSAKNELILSGKSCNELLKRQESICQWSNKRPTTLNCSRTKKDLFTLTISSCLPDFVKQVQNKKLYRAGANCWGTALSFKNHSMKPRFVWSEEMEYWLGSPLCRKLLPGEEKRPGDIINIYGPEYVYADDELDSMGGKFIQALYPDRYLRSPVERGYSGFHRFLHSETLVAHDLTFGKDSPSHLDKFQFRDLRNAYGRPQDPDCQENQTLSPHSREYQNRPKPIKGSKCDYFSVAYRCEDFSKLSENADIQKLMKMQQKLFILLMNSNLLITKLDRDMMLNEADEMATRALEELSLSSLPKNDEMVLVLKYFTASGIRKSLELANLIPPTEEL